MISGLFKNVLELSISGVIVAVIILVVKVLVGRKLSARWHYIIWVVLLVKLIMPVSFHSQVSVFNIVQPLNQAVQSISNKSVPEVAPIIPDNKMPETAQVNNLVAQPINNDSVQVTTNSKELDLMSILSYVWLTGMLVILLGMLFFYLRIYRIIIRNKVSSSPVILNLFQQCLTEARVKKKVSLYCTDGLKSPFVIGVFRPKVIVPVLLTYNLDEAGLKSILMHEITHIKTYDPFVRWLMIIVQSIHWFNPVVWFSINHMIRDCELACDASVIDDYSQDMRKDYANMLLQMGEERVIKSDLSSVLSFGESHLKRRIVDVINHKRYSKITMIVAISILLIVAVILLTNGVLPDSKSSALATQTSSNNNPTPPPTMGSNVLSSEYIFQNSSSAKIDEIEISFLDKNKLGLARNEIFARHGYIFTDETYKNYFAGKDWYKPQVGVDLNSLNNIEKYNVNLIAFFEDKRSKERLLNNRLDVYNFKANTHAVKYNKNKEISIDINGDGKEEKISYQTDGTNYTLEINGAKLSSTGQNIFDDFAIVDINKSDKFKEIMVSESGGSADFSSYYYFYDGNKIISMGSTGGTFDQEINIDGTGKVVAIGGFAILQTWFYPHPFVLSAQHILQKVTQETYTTDYTVFVKKSITIYDNKVSQDKKTTLNEGQSIKLIGTDGKEWCLVETSSGAKGWFAIDAADGYDILREKKQHASDVFVGLYNAG